MKGIYLTEEAKAEIEARMDEIKAYEGPESGMVDDLKKILSSATILPVEENYVSSKYPQGVIIQPKQ